MVQQKVVALLELSGAYSDTTFVPSFNYYWTLYPNFVTFEIVDNKNNIEYLNQLLEEYYQKGYRIFFGPITSTNTRGIIDWFTNHPDATCIVPLAASNTLKLSKNMFRLTPSELYYADYIKQEAPSSTSKVFYFYNPNQLVCIDLLAKLKLEFEIVIEYPVASESELTVELVQDFFNVNNITTNDMVVTLLINGNQREKYFNLFETINIGNVKQYDVRPLGFPKVSNDVTNLYNNYYCVFFSSINTTGIYEDALNTLGKSYASNSLTSVYLLTLLANNQSLDDAYSFGEVVPWFDDKNGIKYWSYSIYMYTSNGFNINNIYLNDPTYGTITFNPKV